MQYMGGDKFIFGQYRAIEDAWDTENGLLVGYESLCALYKHIQKWQSMHRIKMHMFLKLHTLGVLDIVASIVNRAYISIART